MVFTLEELTLINRVSKYWTKGCMWLEFCYHKASKETVPYRSKKKIS